MTPRPKPGAIGRTVGKFVSDILNRLEARTAENAEMISDLDRDLCQHKLDVDQFGEALKFALDNYRDAIKKVDARLDAAEERIELLQALEKRRSS